MLFKTVSLARTSRNDGSKRRLAGIFCVLLSLTCCLGAVEEPYQLQFSRFLGGPGWEFIRDVASDSEGNVYVAGGTTSPSSNFTHTYGEPGGACDVLIAKFTPDGKLLWSTIVGSSSKDDDYAYGLEVDPHGYSYVTGRATPGFPTTPGAMQREFRGFDTGGSHGVQNAFVLKLAPDGTLVFSTYFGTASLCRDLDIDADGEIYLSSSYSPDIGQAPLPASWFTKAYQRQPSGGDDTVLAKLSSDGSTLLWATYMGGSANEVPASTVRLDRSGHVYLVLVTHSTDIPTSANAYDSQLNGKNDAYLAKFSNDGTTLIFGTYFGGSGEDWSTNCHNMALDKEGNAFIVGETTSPDLPTSAGAFQSSFAGAAEGPWEKTGDYFVAKFSADGSEVLACTYYGGASGERAIEGVAVDRHGNLFFSGGTFSKDFPVTSNAFQGTMRGKHNGVLVKLSPDLSHTLFATFMGDDDGGFRASATDSQSSFIGAGSSNSNWPVLDSPPYGGGGTDAIIVKFSLP